MVSVLQCQHGNCGVTVRELTERRALHKMRVHENMSGHDSGHSDAIAEEFGTREDDGSESGDDSDLPDVNSYANRHGSGFIQ